LIAAKYKQVRNPIATPRVTHEQSKGNSNLSRDPRNKDQRLRNEVEATTNKTEQNMVQLRPTESSVSKIGSSEMRPRLIGTHY
jgi:hypothetical protein